MKTRILLAVSFSFSGGLSLNEYLDRRIDLNPELLELKPRFLTGKIGLTADVGKAFLEVGITAENRDAFRLS